MYYIVNPKDLPYVPSELELVLYEGVQLRR